MVNLDAHDRLPPEPFRPSMACRHMPLSRHSAKCSNTPPGWRRRPLAGAPLPHGGGPARRHDAGRPEAADPARQLGLLGGHPELGSRVKRLDWTDASQAEQGGLGLDRLSAEEFDRFTRPQPGLPGEVRLPLHHLRAPAHPRFDPSPVRAAGWTTTCRRRAGRGRSTRSASSPGCAWSDWSTVPASRRPRAGSRPMCSTPSPGARPPA